MSPLKITLWDTSVYINVSLQYWSDFKIKSNKWNYQVNVWKKYFLSSFTFFHRNKIFGWISAVQNEDYIFQTPMQTPMCGRVSKSCPCKWKCCMEASGNLLKRQYECDLWFFFPCNCLGFRCHLGPQRWGQHYKDSTMTWMVSLAFYVR